jgi:hypothetical protein
MLSGALCAAVSLSACAAKPLPIATACAPLSPVQQVTMIEEGLKQAIGPHRGGYHELVESRIDDAEGHKVLTLKQIGPADAPQPGPGEGARAVIVYHPCTAEVISARRL